MRKKGLEQWQHFYGGKGISPEEAASLFYLMRWRRSCERVRESVKEAVIQRIEQVKGKMMRAQRLRGPFHK